MDRRGCFVDGERKDRWKRGCGLMRKSRRGEGREEKEEKAAGETKAALEEIEGADEKVGQV
jgi:hypothetical protein